MWHFDGNDCEACIWCRIFFFNSIPSLLALGQQEKERERGRCTSLWAQIRGWETTLLKRTWQIRAPAFHSRERETSGRDRYLPVPFTFLCYILPLFPFHLSFSLSFSLSTSWRLAAPSESRNILYPESSIMSAKPEARYNNASIHLRYFLPRGSTVSCILRRTFLACILTKPSWLRARVHTQNAVKPSWYIIFPMYLYISIRAPCIVIFPVSTFPLPSLLLSLSSSISAFVYT